MEAGEILEKVRDGMRAKVVYGKPIERDGVTVIPAASLMGGGGGGEAPPGMATEDGSGPETGSGAGFGLVAKPAGAWVIRGQDVEWVPVVDLNRKILLSSIILILVILTARTVILRILHR